MAQPVLSEAVTSMYKRIFEDAFKPLKKQLDEVNSKLAAFQNIQEEHTAEIKNLRDHIAPRILPSVDEDIEKKNIMCQIINVCQVKEKHAKTLEILKNNLASLDSEAQKIESTINYASDELVQKQNLLSEKLALRIHLMKKQQHIREEINNLKIHMSEKQQEEKMLQETLNKIESRKDTPEVKAMIKAAKKRRAHSPLPSFSEDRHLCESPSLPSLSYPGVSDEEEHGSSST